MIINLEWILVHLRGRQTDNLNVSKMQVSETLQFLNSTHQCITLMTRYFMHENRVACDRS
jgi:hypothetical protein